jgi:hypothetical protein
MNAEREFWVLGASFILLALAGCASTVTPTTVNSSIVEIDNGYISRVGHACLITPDAVVRYNALIGRYGNDPLFLPPLKPNDGVTPSGANFLIDDQHMVDFALMNSWRKSQTH